MDCLSVNSFWNVPFITLPTDFSNVGQLLVQVLARVSDHVMCPNRTGILHLHCSLPSMIILCSYDCIPPIDKLTQALGRACLFVPKPTYLLA